MSARYFESPGSSLDMNFAESKEAQAEVFLALDTEQQAGVGFAHINALAGNFYHDGDDDNQKQ